MAWPLLPVSEIGGVVTLVRRATWARASGTVVVVSLGWLLGAAMAVRDVGAPEVVVVARVLTSALMVSLVVLMIGSLVMLCQDASDFRLLRTLGRTVDEEGLRRFLSALRGTSRMDDLVFELRQGHRSVDAGALAMLRRLATADVTVGTRAQRRTALAEAVGCPVRLSELSEYAVDQIVLILEERHTGTQVRQNA